MLSEIVHVQKKLEKMQKNSILGCQIAFVRCIVGQKEGDRERGKLWRDHNGPETTNGRSALWNRKI